MTIKLDDLKTKKKAKISISISAEVNSSLNRLSNVTGVSKSAFIGQFLETTPEIVDQLVDTFIEEKVGKVPAGVLQQLKERADSTVLDIESELTEINSSLLDN